MQTLMGFLLGLAVNALWDLVKWTAGKIKAHWDARHRKGKHSK